MSPAQKLQELRNKIAEIAKKGAPLNMIAHHSTSSSAPISLGAPVTPVAIVSPVPIVAPVSFEKDNVSEDVEEKKVNKPIELREFQKRARNEIIYHVNECLSEGEVSSLSLQAPTGGGKTLILSKSIKGINEERSSNVAFIWLTIGDGGLAEQSKKALSCHLNLSGMKVYSLSEALISCPNNMAGNVVVVNWETLNKEDKDGNPLNLAMKDGEKVSFPEMCEETRKHCPIVLIIDESHTHAETNKSTRIREEIIKPAYTILSSATPSQKLDKEVIITYKEVARSGLIKKNIIVSEFATHNDGIILAANQLVSLLSLAQKVNAAYYSKMLVFVPNADKNGENGEVADILASLRDNYGWTEESGDIKLWFSGAKGTSACKKNLNRTKVIITKEAIDTGIDIPSIQVIVQLRSIKNTRVQIQKIGRGMRMPEQHHYGNALDNLYFFAYQGFEERVDWAGFESAKEAIVKNHIIIRECFRNMVASFAPIKAYRAERAKSFIESETFEEEFFPVFKRMFDEHKTSEDKEKFNFSLDYELALASGTLNLDKSKFEKNKKETVHIAEKSDIGLIYWHMMKNALGHLFKHRDCIEEATELSGKDMQTFLIINLPIVIRLVDQAIAECQSKIKDTKEIPFDYVPPLMYSFNGEVFNLSEENEKFLYDRMHIDRAAKKSDVESEFEKMIHSHENVSFIGRNYDRASGSFSVVYTDRTGKRANFYPDFIIRLNDGRWLIVDPKGNDTEEEAKRLALISALKETNIIGGIVKKEGDYFYLYSDGEKVSVNDLLVKH
jgi:type III restriction enzyme